MGKHLTVRSAIWSRVSEKFFHSRYPEIIFSIFRVIPTQKHVYRPPPPRKKKREKIMKTKRNKESVCSTQTLLQYFHLPHETSCDISCDVGNFPRYFMKYWEFSEVFREILGIFRGISWDIENYSRCFVRYWEFSAVFLEIFGIFRGFSWFLCIYFTISLRTRKDVWRKKCRETSLYIVKKTKLFITERKIMRPCPQLPSFFNPRYISCGFSRLCRQKTTHNCRVKLYSFHMWLHYYG